MSLFIPPTVRADDANGNPLSGAKWYFYATGTTNPLDVYTTSARNVAHPNPVVADSGGKFASIYLDPAVTYRAVLKTSDGSTISDTDPYNRGIDASSIEYIPEGDEATSVGVDEFLDQFFTDLGYPTLQDAIDAAAGKTLYVFRAWSNTAAVTMPGDIEVVGMVGHSITLASGTGNAIVIAGDNVRLRNLRVIGPSLTTEPADVIAGNGIYAAENIAAGATRDNLHVEGCEISGFHMAGIFIAGGRNIRVVNNRLHGNLYNAPYTKGDVSDILFYSGTNQLGGRVVITGNFCLSNNSQGIAVNILGRDSDILIGNNVCAVPAGRMDFTAGLVEIEAGDTIEGATSGATATVTRIYLASGAWGSTAAGFMEIEGQLGEFEAETIEVGGVASATVAGDSDVGQVVRRHGIQTGYGQEARGGRIAVTGNVVRNSSCTGLYLASSNNLPHAISAVGNVISLIGFGTQQPTLNGGITINGGGVGTLVEGNAIYDFRGDPAQGTGCVTGIVSDAAMDDASAQIINNTFDTSSSDGVNLKSRAAGWVVRGNIFRGIARYEFFEAAANGGGHFFEDNNILRANTTYPSVYIGHDGSNRTTYVRRNYFEGAGLTASFENCPVRVERIETGGVEKPVVITDNTMVNYYYGVTCGAGFAGRRLESFVIDRNIFASITRAVSLQGDATACMLLVDNIFRSVTLKVHGDGAFIGRREGDRAVLLDLNAAPTTGTWSNNDEVIRNAPSAGGKRGLVRIGGAWKDWGAIDA